MCVTLRYIRVVHVRIGNHWFVNLSRSQPNSAKYLALLSGANAAFSPDLISPIRLSAILIKPLSVWIAFVHAFINHDLNTALRDL